MQWVPGYWADTQDGWVWVPGTAQSHCLIWLQYDHAVRQLCP
ncbi:hypothetical protein [Stieleria sedimenti]